MNENENNFEALRRLLALKRHEVPPPGYFVNFSSEVRARLRASEGNRTVNVSERGVEELPWLFRLLSVFEAKPAFAGSFASALCLLLLFGIVYAEQQPDVSLQPLLQTAQISSPLAMATPVNVPSAQPVFLSNTSTNPVFNTQSALSWFDSQTAVAQPVSFTLPGN